MSILNYIEKLQLEELFGMSRGSVLDFSNREYANFFKEVVDIDIYARQYDINSGSKAQRLRGFLEIEQNAIIVGKVLEQMLAIWLHKQSDKDKAGSNENYVSIQKTVTRLLGNKSNTATTETNFLNEDFSKNICISKLPIDSRLVPIIESRLQEINNCLEANAPFAVVILTGSILEGLLLGCARQDPQRFNQATASPKDINGKVQQFHHWKLKDFIDVAYDVGIIKVDIKKFSHCLRDFRNYIHPHEQLSLRFTPDMHTAKICLQVLKAVIAELNEER